VTVRSEINHWKQQNHSLPQQYILWSCSHTSSNEEVVRSADIVFVGLLPGPAREVLPNMPFNSKHIVISMMAAVDINELVSLVGKVDESRIVRTVPLPSNSQRTGIQGQK
jgi:pyrroline-5-carboxylate reductase